MRNIIMLAMMAIIWMGCTDVNCNVPSEISETSQTVLSAPLLTSFGADKAIYIDQNKIATIISKSGDILSQTDLTKAKPIQSYASWKTSIPAHSKDTLYASAKFIDDVIYYEYHVEKGRTYGMKPYLGGSIKLVDLPCQSGWIVDVDNRLYYTCKGKIQASLSIWKEVLDEWSLNTTIQISY